MSEYFFLIAESFDSSNGYIGQFKMVGRFTPGDLYRVNEILRRRWVKDG